MNEKLRPEVYDNVNNLCEGSCKGIKDAVEKVCTVETRISEIRTTVMECRDRSDK